MATSPDGWTANMVYHDSEAPDERPPRRRRADRVFRVSGVPLDWDTNRLQDFLEGQDALRLSSGRPLAPAISFLFLDVYGDTKTGTVALHSIPPTLQKIPRLSMKVLASPAESPTPQGPVRSRFIKLDDEFLGLTTLFSPEPEHHEIDIIAISGVGGHAFGSFKERGGENMWLRDDLPYDITGGDNQPIARVMAYGYKSRLPGSESVQNLGSLASSFYNTLLVLSNAKRIRPVIFIGHSLGGLIIKQALIILKNSERPEDQKLLQAVYGIAFFGVPHLGMDITSLIPMVEGQPNAFLVESISQVESHLTDELQQNFYSTLGGKGDSEIVSFFETQLSPTAQLVDGEWEMSGPASLLVSEASATNCRPWETGPEHACAIERTHSDMVKFGVHDPEYKMVLQRLKGLAHRAVERGRSGRSPQRAHSTPKAPKPETHFTVGFKRNESFVGREAILSKLLERIRPGSGREGCRMTALEGLGGVGKTQIAIEVAYRLRDQDPDCSIFWVPAITRTGFEDAYRTIAQKLGIQGADNITADVKLLVKAALEREDGSKWLLIVDNADDVKLLFGGNSLAQYIPSRRGASVLFTTRNSQVTTGLDSGVVPFPVAAMNTSEALQLLESNIFDVNLVRGANADSSRDLLKVVTNLPLAVKQASAYMRKNKITSKRYLQMYRSNEENMTKLLRQEFTDHGRYDDLGNALATTFIISFAQIEESNKLAAEYLQLMSLFAQQDIPRRLLPNGNSIVEEEEALGLLKSYAFISERQAGSFDIHRLIQVSARAWMRQSQKWDSFLDRAMKALSHTYPTVRRANHKEWAPSFPHVQAASRFKTGDKLLQLKIADSLLELGKFSEAEEIERMLLAADEKNYGRGHWKAIEIKNRLAGTVHSQGKFKEALELRREVLKGRKKILGRTHPDTLRSMAGFAMSLSRLNEDAEAEMTYHEVVVAMENTLGPDHLDTIDTRSRYGRHLGHLGKYRKAEQVLSLALASARRVLGESHLITLYCSCYLASVLPHFERHGEAKVLLEETLRTAKQVCGETNPHSLYIMNELALFLHSVGQEAEAIALMEKCYRSRVDVFGTNYIDTQGSLRMVQEWEDIIRQRESSSARKSALPPGAAGARRERRETREASSTRRRDGREELYGYRIPGRRTGGTSMGERAEASTKRQSNGWSLPWRRRGE